jgi:pre-mRNA-splicing factor SYF1
MNRRPLLVNTVLLKQNPHNVSEWLKRVRIVGDNDRIAAVQYVLLLFSSLFRSRPVRVFAEATKVIDPKKADGKLSTLWIAFAGLYEANGDLDSARHIFTK